MADISLEIHHLDVRGGDATAIIVKQHHADHNMDTEEPEETETELYRVLIDAGAEGSGSGALKYYLQTHLKGPFDLVVATHYHQDHIQGFSQAKIKFKKFLDNGSYKDADGTQLTPKNDIGKGARTKIFDNYVTRTQTEMVFSPDEKAKPTRVPIPFIKKNSTPADVGPVEIELGTGTGIKLIIYAANGVLANGTDVLGNLSRQKRKAISPNDVSLAMVIEWGNFRYLTMGDLSGDEDQTSYYDIEKPLVDYLVPAPPKVGPLTNKPITVFKASHHGSEFSNQSHLLKTLQPDSIIVCCNLQKQVPSPIFLERLSEYFKENDGSKVVFTNTMKVFKQDDRYTGLQGIAKSIVPGNVEFEAGDDEELASNLKMKCAVIRRRVEDGKVVMQKSPEKATVISNLDLGYDIVLMERDADDANQVAQTVRFTSYALTTVWPNISCGQAEIVKGFEEQADAMIRWLANDEEIKETSGFDYLSEHYPALPTVIRESESDVLKEALVQKMTAMFTASFWLDKTKDWVWKPTGKNNNNLTSDEKKTIFNLLWYNYHQPVWNLSYRRSGRNPYVREKAWNAAAGTNPEPGSQSGMKRVAEQGPTERKKRRTSK